MCWGHPRVVLYSLEDMIISLSQDLDNTSTHFRSVNRQLPNQLPLDKGFDPSY